MESKNNIDIENKNETKKPIKETIYDKIDIPLKKIDNFLIGAIIFLIVISILIMFI